MKIITGIAVITTAEGERVTYTYSEVDEAGQVTGTNIKRSFIALDTETQNVIASLKTKVNENLNPV